MSYFFTLNEFFNYNWNNYNFKYFPVNNGQQIVTFIFKKKWNQTEPKNLKFFYTIKSRLKISVNKNYARETRLNFIYFKSNTRV